MRTKKSKKSNKGIPRAVFTRIVREVTEDFKEGMMWQPEGIDALKESCEEMLKERFEKAANLAQMCKLETIRVEHLVGAA